MGIPLVPAILLAIAIGCLGACILWRIYLEIVWCIESPFYRNRWNPWFWYPNFLWLRRK
jgi:hypothetical protein